MSLILHLKKENLFNFNYSQQNVYPITFSSNVFLINSNFKFGNTYYNNSQYYLKYKTNIDTLNKWITFLNFYIDNKSGYFNNTINSTNLEKNLIIMNDDLNYLNNNLNSLQNIIDTSFSNINGTDTEFNAYLQNYYNEIQNKDDENPFIIIPICMTCEFVADDKTNQNSLTLKNYNNRFNNLVKYFKGESLSSQEDLELISNLFTGELTTDNSNKITSVNNEYDFLLKLENDESIKEPYITKCLPYYNNIFGKYLIFALVEYSNWYMTTGDIKILSYMQFDIISYVCLRLKKDIITYSRPKGFDIEIGNDILKKCSIKNLEGSIKQNKLCDYDFMNVNNWELISYYIGSV